MRARRIVIAVALLALLWWLWPRTVPVSAPPPQAAPTPAPVAAARAPAERPVARRDDRPPERMVRCVSSVIADYGRVTLTEHDPDSLVPLGPLQPTFNDDEMLFEPRNVDGIGVLTVPLHHPTAIAWVDGACTDLVDPEPYQLSTLWVTVTDLPPVAEGRTRDPLFFDTDCGESRTTKVGAPDYGPWQVRVHGEGRCTVRAMLPFGGRFLYGDPVEVQLDFDAPTELELAAPLPSEDAPGWDLNDEPEGLRVVEVYPGSLAWEAGVRAGDLLLDIDGEDAAELSADGLHDTPGPDRIAWQRGDERFTAPLRRTP